MKRKITLIIVCTLLSIINFIAQNSLWSLPSNFLDGTFQLDDLPDPGNPVSAMHQVGQNWPEYYDGRPASHASNMMPDENGNIRFFIIDGYVYDANGVLLDIFTLSFSGDLLDDEPIRGYYEFGICPVPNECNKYYIIGADISSGGNFPNGFNNVVAYGVFSFEEESPFQANVNGAFERETSDIFYLEEVSDHFVKAGNFDCNYFMEITRPNDDNERFLFISNIESLFMYKIDRYGIHYVNEIDNAYDDPQVGTIPKTVGDLAVFYLPNEYLVAWSFSSNVGPIGSIPDNFEIVKVVKLDNLGNVNKEGLFFFPVGIDSLSTYDVENPKVTGLEFTRADPNYLCNNCNPFFPNETLDHDIRLIINHTGISTFNPFLSNNIVVLGVDLINNPAEIALLNEQFFEVPSLRYSNIKTGNNGNLYFVNNTEVNVLNQISLNQQVAASINYSSPQAHSNATQNTLGTTQNSLPNTIRENYFDIYNATCCFAPEIHYKIFNVSPQTATWDGNTLNNPFNSDEIIIRETLYFPPGADVTIKDMTIRFDAGAKMIIDNGAKVTLENTTLTNRCNELWDGIEVYGNATVSHSSILQHGQLIMENSEINNAKKGAMMYARTSNGNVDFSRCGGVIKATESTFRNNIKDVEFFPFSFSNFSAFTFCNFLSDDNMVDGINSEAHLSLFGVRNVKIKGCTFTNNQSNAPYNLKGTGITSFDANFSVDFGCNSILKPCPIADQQKSSFNNLYEGLYAQASNPVISFSVKNSTFNNCYKGIYMGGVDYAIIRDNFFNLVEEQDVNNFPYGIYSQSCTGYSIDNNEMLGPNNVTTFGLIINNSNNQGNSNDVNFVYKNEFNSVKYSSVAMNANVGYKETDFGQINTFPRSGLKYKCNNFTNSQDVDIFIQENGGISPIQGRCFNPTTGANNRFNSPNASIGNFWNNNTLFFDIDYRYNFTPTNIYQVGTYNFFTTDVSDCPTPFDAQLNVCPTNMYKSTAEQGLKDEIILIENEIGTKEQNLVNFDNNYEAVWNAKQNGNMSWGNFKNNVMAMEPIIKQERLIAFINSNPPGGIAKQILIYNSPLTDTTLQAVIGSNLSNGIKNNIINAQNLNSKNERVNRELDIDYLYAEKTSYTNELIRFYIHDDESKMDLEKLDEFLKQNNDVYCKCQSVNVKIADRKYNEAQLLVDSLKTIDNGKFDDFCSFREQLIDFANQVENCFIIKQDTIRKQRVELIANKGYGERTCFAANILLNRIFEYDFQEEKPQFNVSKSFGSSNNEITQFDEETTIEMYPNPTNGIVTFELDFVSYENIAIEVYNLQGQMVIATSIDSQESYIDLSNLNDGLYFIKTKLSENETKVTKMILRK